MNSYQPIGINGDFRSVPVIPADLDVTQIDQLFPKGFDDILSYDVNHINGIINITISTDENRAHSMITINRELYNPSYVGARFPRFLLEQEYRKQKIDYLSDDPSNRYILNQNELLYLAIQHRLCDLKRFKSAYANLLNTDIKQVMNFLDRNPSFAYNDEQKKKNMMVILSLFDYKTKTFKKSGKKHCVGDLLKTGQHLTPKSYLLSLLGRLPIHFSSESMGEDNKFVIAPYDQELYRSVGYRMTENEKGEPVAITLFKPAQNAPARNKTHVTANALEISGFKGVSHFMQDFIVNKAKTAYEPKDHCYRKSIVVIHPILDNNKFLFGEIEASPEFVQTLVYDQHSVTEEFEEFFVEQGIVYPANDKGQLVIGLDAKENPVYLTGIVDAQLIRTTVVGVKGVHKLTFKVSRMAGNARIDSNTGLKGVTTCRPNLGNIHIPDLNMDIKPDLVFGMNSFKAKKNGIALARAALAVELGLYTPKHRTALLNTWDEDEIQEAAESLPEYTYRDMFGNIQKVQIGIVYARFTELCDVYKSYEHKPFSFEFGRVLNNLPDNQLFKNIWEQYVPQDTVDLVIELEKILLDSNNIYNDDIPTYSPESIINRKIFTKEDLILNIQLMSESNSRLLDPEYNKGFFIDFRSVGGKIIRFPSAAILQRYSSETESKMYLYSALAVIISNILSKTLNKQYRFLFPQSEEAKAKANTDIHRYYKEIKGTIFSSEDSAKMLIQSLSRPEVPAISMKQSTDYILPDNVCLIMCDKTYAAAARGALGKNYKAYLADNEFYGIHGRAPFLWSAQACANRIWSKQDFSMYLFNKHGILLEDYIHPTLNNDIMIFSNNILKRSQSDVDGDHAANSIPADTDQHHNQALLKEFFDPNITQSQYDWIDAYIAGEREANDDLIDPKTGNLHPVKYQLYELPMHMKKLTRNSTQEGFDLYLTRAIVAKANIGVATNDGWIFNMLLEIYCEYYSQNNGQYQVSETAQVKDMRRITPEQRNELSFSYTRALQDFVVRGVKHSGNGSEDFEILFLKNIGDNESKAAYSLLTQDLKLPPIFATKMIGVVTWATEMGFLKACSAFLKLYNKGTIPDPETQELLDKHDTLIQSSCYFGRLHEPVYNIRKQAETARALTSAGKAKKREIILAEIDLNAAI